MKFDVDDKNRCRLVCVKFYLNQCRFAVAVAKCLGGSLFWDTCSVLTMTPQGRQYLSPRRILKLTHQGAPPIRRAESVIYNCLVGTASCKV